MPEAQALTEPRAAPPGGGPPKAGSSTFATGRVVLLSVGHMIHDAFLIFGGTPVLLALVQELLPEVRSTASGLYFSINYVLTGTSAILFALAADAWGIQTAFLLLAFAPWLTLPLAFLLPERPVAPGR